MIQFKIIFWVGLEINKFIIIKDLFKLKIKLIKLVAIYFKEIILRINHLNFFDDCFNLYDLYPEQSLATSIDSIGLKKFKIWIKR